MSHVNLFGFWLFATSMFVFSVLNLLILLSIVSVLKMGPSTGLAFFESIPMPKSVIKFFGDVDFNKIFLRQSLIESFQDQPIEITSTAEDNSNFRITVGNNQVFEMDEFLTTFKGFDNFFLGNYLNLSKINFKVDSLNSLQTEFLHSNHFKAPLDRDLVVNGDSNIWFKGAEDVKLRGRDLKLSSNQYLVRLKSHKGRINFNANGGIFMLFANQDEDNSKNVTNISYKLCICKRNAKIFKIPIINNIENCSFFAQC